MTKSDKQRIERLIENQSLHLNTKQFNHDCGVSAARGSFYDRWKAKNKQIRLA